MNGGCKSWRCPPVFRPIRHPRSPDPPVGRGNACRVLLQRCDSCTMHSESELAGPRVLPEGGRCGVGRDVAGHFSCCRTGTEIAGRRCTPPDQSCGPRSIAGIPEGSGQPGRCPSSTAGCSTAERGPPGAYPSTRILQPRPPNAPTPDPAEKWLAESGAVLPSVTSSTSGTRHLTHGPHPWNRPSMSVVRSVVPRR